MSDVKDKVEGSWKQLTGKIKQKYGKLTDDDLKVAEGNKDELVGRIKEKTGEAKEKIKSFVDSL